MLELHHADLSNTSHADACTFLLDCYARDPMGGGQGLSAFSRNNIAAALKDRHGCCVIIAYQGEKPVGLLIGFEGFSTFACKPLLNIHDVVVIPQCRGQGIASRLLREAEQIAQQRGYCKLTLEVLEGNHTALNAYTRFGFVNYQLDPELGKAVFLEKKLS